MAEQLLARGRIPRGYLGLGLQPVRLDEALVKTSSLANPVVDLVPDLRLGLAPAGVAGLWRAIVPGDDRYADDLDTLGFHARGDGAQSIDNLHRRCLATDVVGAHEHHNVAHAGMGEHVAVEPLEAGRAVGSRLHLAADGIAADPLVDHCALRHVLQRQAFCRNVLPAVVRV